MIDNIKAFQVANSWNEFAKQYDIRVDCTTYLEQLEMLSRLHNGNCYPQLILPNKLCSKLNQSFIRGMKLRTDKNGIYLQDIIAEAKKIDTNNSDLEYIVPPSYPYPPQIDKVSETKLIFITNNHWGCWGTIIGLLLLICICSALGTGELGAGILYAFAFVPIFLVLAHQYGAMKSTREMKTVRLSDSEINLKKKEAKDKYESQLQQYRENKLTYDARLENYKLTQRANMSRIEKIIDKILWHLSGRFRTKIDIYAERANETPQRGRSENILFERLMESMPNYVKVDMQVGRYYPDICVIIPEVFALDIEVDEPYTLDSKIETHYHGCGDEIRNEVFANNGWFVLRFSEEQIITQTDECIEIIDSLVSYIHYGKFENLKRLFHTMELMAKPRWTKEQARLMMIKNSRDQY